MDDKEPQKIPVGEIDADDGTDDLKDLIENIKSLGLLQPITVYQKSDTKKYVILAGQRRYSAFVELNKKYPGEGWDKIPAVVVDVSDDDQFHPQDPA